MSSDYLKVTYSSEIPPNQKCYPYKYRLTPFARTNGEIFCAKIGEVQKLTNKGEDVKTVYNIHLEADLFKDFLPGDTIGLLPSNDELLINKLLIRLNLEKIANEPCELKILQGITKKNIPRHLPNISTLKNIFLNHVDIHTPPKKLFLKSLCRFVQDSEERAKMEQICLPKHSMKYTELITTSCATLLGLLNTFPSCQPSVEVILEHLPPLLPRPYSISSSPASCRLSITFFVLEKDDGTKGVCTGWLEKLILEASNQKIPFYFRQPSKFRVPEDDSIPLILIATGTGIAPFRGFLQHRKLQGKEQSCMWLFYGCRYKDRDFLFKEELEDYVRLGLLNKMSLSFSRDSESKNYVQNSIEQHGGEFNNWVIKKQAKIFICGDFKTVVEEVKTTIKKIFVKHDDMSEIQADNFMKELESEDRFLADMWI